MLPLRSDCMLLLNKATVMWGRCSGEQMQPSYQGRDVCSIHVQMSNINMHHVTSLALARYHASVKGMAIIDYMSDLQNASVCASAAHMQLRASEQKNNNDRQEDDLIKCELAGGRSARPVCKLVSTSGASRQGPRACSSRQLPSFTSKPT